MSRKIEQKSLKAKIYQLREMLRMSRDLNRALFDHSPVGISIRSRSGTLLFVNKAWKKIWQLSNRQIWENERISKNWSLQKRYPYLKNMISKFRHVFKYGGELFLPEIKVDNPNPRTARGLSQYYSARPFCPGKSCPGQDLWL